MDTLAVKFAGLGLNEVVPALRVKEDPTEATYQLFEESGTDLGQVLTKKEALKAMKSAMSPDVARAHLHQGDGPLRALLRHRCEQGGAQHYERGD